MMEELSIAAAFVFGVSSAPHCLGMCGGLAGAMNTLPERALHTRAALWRNSLLQNAGRVCSYTLMGAVFAAAGAPLAGAGFAELGRIIIGLVFVLLGIHFILEWQGLRLTERLGQPLWNQAKPFAQRLLPARTGRAGFMLGMVWGLLPCGLVYTMLLAAAASTHAGYGAALMLAFGLGTLPVMSVCSWLTLSGRNRLQIAGLRKAVGVGAVFLGIWIMIQAASTLGAGGRLHSH